MNFVLVKRLLVAGWKQWLRSRSFHLATIAGLATGVALLMQLLTLPEAIQTKVSLLDSRLPSHVNFKDITVNGTDVFQSFFYIERWHGQSIEILAVSADSMPLSLPSGGVLLRSGDIVASHGLNNELTKTSSPDSLMRHLGGSRISKVLPLEADAEPGELFAYVATTQVALTRMCKCTTEQLGYSSFKIQSNRSSNHLSYGYILLSVLASVVFIGVLFNSLMLALRLRFDRERRLVAEMNLMGAPSWTGALLLGTGFVINTSIAFAIGSFLARGLGMFLATKPPSGYRLPQSSIGFPSLPISVISFVSLLLVLFLALRHVIDGLQNGHVLDEVRSGESKSNSTPVWFARSGWALLLTVWFLGGIADSQTALVSLILGLGIILTSIGLSHSSKTFQIFMSRILAKEIGAAPFYFLSLIRVKPREVGVMGVLVGLVIASGIVTSYGAIADGGDAYTLGRSYQSLMPNTAVVTGIDMSESRMLEQLGTEETAPMQLAIGVDLEGKQHRILVANCGRLQRFVVANNKFECKDGASILINQENFTKASGTEWQAPPPENSVLQSLSSEGRKNGEIKIGRYSSGAIDLPGDIWLSGAFVIVDPRNVKIQPDSRAQRWMYVSPKAIDIEKLRDKLAPSAVSDVQTAKELSVSGNRKQMKFFKDASLWFGLVLSLLGGLSLGLGAISEVARMRKNILAAYLVGARQRDVFLAVIASGVVPTLGVLIYSCCAATLAGMGFARLTSAHEYGLSGPLYGFHWWLIAAVSITALTSALMVRALIVLTNSRKLELSDLQ